MQHDALRFALAIGISRRPSSRRRIQFDIERQRPATLVIVPEDAAHEPQVLAIPPSEYPAVAEALVSIGLHIYPHDDQPAGEAAG